MDDAEIQRFWVRTGSVHPGAAVAVALAALVTVAMMQTLMVLASPGARTIAIWVVAAVLIAAIAAMLLVETVSVWARGAIVLVAAQIAIAGATAVAWSGRQPRDGFLPTLAERMPVHVWAVGLGLAVIAVGAWAGHRRGVQRALAAGAVLTLGYLLALGLWAPVACAAAVEGQDVFWVNVEEVVDQVLITALVPPAIVAILLAGLAAVIASGRWRAPRWLATAGLIALVLPLTMAIETVRTSRPTMPLLGMVYANLAHVLFAVWSLAACTLVALALAHRRIRRVPAQRGVQGGVVEVTAASRREVARLHQHGWLAGLTTTVDAFTLRTAAGRVHVPAGARLDAAVALESTRARAGDTCPVICAGDRVTVSGFVDSGGDGPLRSSGLPVAGTAGMVVTVARGDGETIGRDVILLLWRPCLLLLVVSALAALPGVLLAP